MKHLRQTNFLPRRPASRTLQAATASVVTLCAVMLVGLLSGYGNSRHQEATIGSAVGTEGETADPSVAPARLPRPLGTIAVNSIATGLEADTVRYYEELTGRAFLTNLRTGHTTTLSDSPLPGFARSWWLPGSSAVISAFYQHGATEHRYYDYATKRTETVGDAITSLAAAPNGRQIAFLAQADGAMAISIAEVDGTEPRRILKSRAESAELSWPKNDMLALASKRSDRSGVDLTAVTLDGELLPIITNRDSLEYVWSRDGRYLLFSYFAPGSGIMLWYRDLSSGLEVPLGITTGARKCAWHPAGTAITCGVPSKSSLVSGISSAMTATLDDIVTLDLAAGTEHRAHSSRQGMLLGVIDPLVSSSGKYFVFTNLFDHRLYSLEL